jgi:hypothetical protein
MVYQEADDSTPTSIDEAFCDTCILLNFAQQEWERDRTTTLLEQAIRFVISEAVKEEFDSVTERRLDAYENLLAFLVDGEDAVDQFDPDVWGNDERHIYGIIGELETLDPEQTATEFRTYLRKFRARQEYIMTDVVDEVIFTSPPLFFANDLQDVIPNSADCKVIAEAADWTQESGSGVVVTMDGEDILDKTEAINREIAEEYENSRPLIIMSPEAALERVKGS